MNPGDKFPGGTVFRILRMPQGDDLFVLSMPAVLTMDDVERQNHNVFRVDRDGHVLWQITRIDHPGTNWEFKHEQARERGEPGCIEPFIYFRLRLPDGSTNMDFGMPQDSMDWISGCPVELANLGFGSQWFSLDIDTGVAIEITPMGTKAW